MTKNLNIRSNKFSDRVKYKIDCAVKACKNSGCTFQGFHLHKYTKGDLTRFMISEKLRKDGYDWTPEVVRLDEKDIEGAEFIQKKRLLAISYNEEYLKKLMARNQDRVEYEYEYEDDEWNGGYFETVTDYDWTSDINQDGITGRRRLCHRVYQAYKVVEDEDGEYELVGSPLVDDIMTVKDEYPYFREDDNFMTYRDLRNINVKRRLR
jgi:hypothetical protein